MKENNRRSFVPRSKLKDLVQCPTPKDLYDTMHITSCELVYTAKDWDPKWMFCPVCGKHIDKDGLVMHTVRRDPKCLV